LDDLAIAVEVDLAVAAVDLRADVELVTVFRAAGLLNGLLHRGQHLVAVNALLARHRVGHVQELGPRGRDRHVHVRCHYFRALSACFIVWAINASVITSFAFSISSKGNSTSPPSTPIRTLRSVASTSVPRNL